MSFQPSINISYDIGKPDIFEQYVPNIKQLEIMDVVLSNLITAEQHSNIIVGPYGAGKSLVATMITSLLTERTNKKEFKQFFKDVQTVAPSIEEHIKDVILKKEFRWVPITITGKSGDFENIILDSIEKQCKEHDISIVLKHDATYILELISSWKKSFKEAYDRLVSCLNERDITINILKEQLVAGEESAVEIFKEIYPSIVFGTQYYNPKKLAFIEQIEYIFKQLNKKKVGLFIVFDEFGRFLQTVSNQLIYDTMQQIQNLAEFANRQSNMGLLLITHTGLQQYSTANKNLSKEELERVEKRFLEHRLESDSAIFYRSAHKLINKDTDIESLFLSTDYEDISYYIMKYNLFADMTKEEIEGAIISGCQPIHPLTIQLLPSISNQLGQNDRTLYMFLNEFDVTKAENNWYFADQLFDYFYPDESILLTLDSMKYYRLALKYNLSVNAIRIVKMATLLNLINTVFPINKEFIGFATGLSKGEVHIAFEELLNAKLLRINPYTKSYELYEGTLLSVENLIEEVSNTFVLTDDQRCEAIEMMYEERYYIPLRYNTTKSMTRFIESHFTFGIEMKDLEEKNNDGTLLFVLSRSAKEKEDALEIITQHKNNNVLFGVVNLDMISVFNQIDQYLLLQKILNTPELLNQDYNLRQELEMRIESIKYEIKQFMMPIKELKKEAIEFYLSEEKINDLTKYKFDTLLDQWMFTRYPNTPEIRNESFNKTKIMGVQKKAAISILNQILNPAFDGEFKVEGNGPDYLIYATTFKNTNFNFKDLDNQENEDFAKLRAALLELLLEKNRNSISALFNIALNKPFGIRAPLVPLLVISLLKDKWHQMAFYAKDFSVPEMSAEMLYEIFEHDATFYEFEIYDLDQEVVDVLQNLNEVYCDSQSVAHPYVLFKDLYKWLLNLPRFTQITNKQITELDVFKQIIRSSESDPILASKKMLELDYSMDKMQDVKETLETFIEDFKPHIIQKTLDIFEVDDKNEIKSKYSELIKKSPQLLEITSLIEKETFIEDLILKIVGVPLEDWSDVTYDSYFATLEQLLIVNNDDVIQIVEGNQVIDTIKEVELSVKGKTIYKQLDRIVTAGGRTMNPEEVKFILYKILQEMK